MRLSGRPVFLADTQLWSCSSRQYSSGSMGPRLWGNLLQFCFLYFSRSSLVPLNLKWEGWRGWGLSCQKSQPNVGLGFAWNQSRIHQFRYYLPARADSNSSRASGKRVCNCQQKNNHRQYVMTFDSRAKGELNLRNAFSVLQVLVLLCPYLVLAAHLNLPEHR